MVTFSMSMRRTVNESELLGGWSGLEFAAGAGRVGVFLDHDVPDGEVEIINLDSWIVLSGKRHVLDGESRWR